QNLVDDNANLDRTAPQQSFALESGFLQYPDRRHIVREHERENSGQLVVVERPLRRSRDRARCQSSPPEFLAQPVAHLRAEAGNVASQLKPHSPDNLAAMLDGEGTLGLLRVRVVEKVDAVMPRVGMRKLVAQIVR